MVEFINIRLALFSLLKKDPFYYAFTPTKVQNPTSDSVRSEIHENIRRNGYMIKEDNTFFW